MSFIDIEPQKAHELLNKEPFTVFDMRDLSSFNSEHIPGAVPANDFALEQLINRKKKMENVLIYCYLGNSSRELSGFLSKFGFKNIYNLMGGYTAWKKYFSQQSQLPEQTSVQDIQNITDPVSAWMINKGFDTLNLKDRIANGNTALMEAAIEGNFEIICALLQQGADANMVNADENISLWFACFSNRLDIIEKLIPSTRNINHQNINGATCLSYAASSGKFEVVQKLVEAGADARIETHDGFSALELSSTAPILKYLKTVCRSNAVGA